MPNGVGRDAAGEDDGGDGGGIGCGEQRDGRVDGGAGGDGGGADGPRQRQRIDWGMRRLLCDAASPANDRPACPPNDGRNLCE